MRNGARARSVHVYARLSWRTALTAHGLLQCHDGDGTEALEVARIGMGMRAVGRTSTLPDSARHGYANPAAQAL